jgi:hypothetical protein
MRVIARQERPHPGAQLRLTDVDGHRVTCFATRARGGQLADLELAHRRRARCEDRIRNAKDTGLRAPAARLRPEPALVRARRPGRRADRLGPDARPARHARPPLGVPPPAVPPVRHGRAHRPRRPPGTPPPRGCLTMVAPHHHRAQPPRRPRPRLAPATRPGHRKGHPPGNRGTPPPGATSGHPRCPQPEKTTRPAAQATEPRSRNIEARVQVASDQQRCIDRGLQRLGC